MKFSFRLIFVVLCLFFTTAKNIAAQEDDYNIFSWDELADQSDKDKSADQLIEEATILLRDQRPLDARTKLLAALAKDPKAYRAQMLLANYYIVEVGHFRLALKYAKQALNLFYEQEGKPPYFSYGYRTQHGYLLYLISQARLNLDDYKGALETLDEYAGYGYQDDWYHSTRAWVLMKMGRIDDAITVAREGAGYNAEIGRTMNILGILLSMKGQRQASIDIFEKAIRYEFSQGNSGFPATPLNNVGEVYKEIFNEPKAESSWLKATNLQDGCDHVLPALNLAMLMLDKLNIFAAKKAIDNFEACFAQFPLKNGEEHKALVHMIRGRIELHAGKVKEAEEHFRQGLDKQQWFGRIGTSQDDLKVGLLISSAEGLKTENNHLKLRQAEDFKDYLKNSYTIARNDMQIWWFKRRARQIMIDNLNMMEDLFIRNTDSMIEYPSLGEALKVIPTAILLKKIELEKKQDDRPQAQLYYELYLAENLLEHGKSEKALTLLNHVLSSARPDADILLAARALIAKLSRLDKNSSDYAELSEAAYKMSPALLRNAALPLPVNLKSTDSSIAEKLSGSNFLPSAKEMPFHLIIDNSKGFKLDFIQETSGSNKSITVTADSLEKALNALANEVFTLKLN